MNAPPESYLRGLDAMIRVIKSRVSSGLRPEFLLPPKGVLVIAAIGDLPKIAKNDDARSLVQTLVELVEEAPTMLMLDVALRRCNVQVERAKGLAELGLTAGCVFPLKSMGEG